MKNPGFTVLFAVVMSALSGGSTLALTVTSSQSGNWSATSTWGGNPIPVAGDDVIINGGFTVTVDIPNATCLSIQLGGSALGQGTGTLAFASGSHVTVSGALSIGPFNNNTTAGNLTMAGGGTLTCEGLIVGRLGTWTAGTGTIELTATNSIPNDNNVNFNNLTMSGGTTSLTRNVTITGNVIINPGSTLDGGANTTTLGGDWVNNGVFSGNTGTVTFDRNGNQSISGTGINNFNLIRVNLGTSINNTLEVAAANFSAADPFLTITNGTFKMSGSFTFANTFITGPIYNIDPGTGLWINNPNVTVIAQAGGGVSVRGMLRLSAGTYNIGTAVDNSLTYVTGSSIIVEGGALNIAGRLTRNNATATTSYTHSGGTVTVVTQGSTDAVFGGFDLGAVGSSFTMSGGSIVIRNATNAPADYVNASSVATVTGGTLQIGDLNSAGSQTIRIQSSRPVGNLLVSNATAQLVSSSLTVAGNIMIQTGMTLNANGLNLSLGGDWTNGGAFSSGGNTVIFNGSGAQTLTAGGTGVGKTFNNLAISKTGGILALAGSTSVLGAFGLTQGTIAVGSNILTLNSTVTGGGTLTSANAGTVSYNQAGNGQNVLAGSYGNLVFNNSAKTLASTGTLGVAGTFTPGTASGHTVTGSTIDFNGASQTIPAFEYNNLMLSGSGTKTGSGTITVGGNLTNIAGIVFSGTTILTLNGTASSNAGTLNTATLSIGPGATLMNNGTVTASLALTGGGTLAQGQAGILNIGGSIEIANLTASAPGNTVTYAGADQTVAPVPYHHLTLSGTGAVVLTGVNTINGTFTLSGAVTTSATTGINIGGDLTIGLGATFSAASFSHSLAGNLGISGTFNPGTSSMTFAGSIPQTISGSSFFNLIINNPAGVLMSGDEIVFGELSLTTGSFSIGAHTLTLNGLITAASGTLIGGASSSLVIAGSGASTPVPTITLSDLTLDRSAGASLSGDITIDGALTITDGTLTTGAHSVFLGSSASLSEVEGQPIVGTITTTRNITGTSGTFSFGSVGADITLNGVAPGITTVLRKTGTVSTGGGHTSIKRYFEITPSVNAGLNAGLTFHYDTTEVNFQNPGILELYRSRNDGGTWNNVGGISNVALHTITVTGINDFSRWTVADTANQLGNTAVPTTTGINPASTTVGDSAFVLMVNGTEFVGGKSTVRFNGSDRPTTYVNASQLTASISAGGLQVVGAFPVTVFNTGGGGLSNPQTFTVNVGAAAVVRVETAADGSGTVVPAQSLTSGSSITVFAITRDVFNNFVTNVAADTWALQNITGGVVTGDLVPSSDRRSATLIGRLVGSANIAASSGSLIASSSGTVTVTAGSAVRVRVETAADGSGDVVPAESLRVGSSITVYAITRDSANNFVANQPAAVWSLQNITGGVSAADLVPSGDSASAVFTGHVVGSANIAAASGSLGRVVSGTITVLPQTDVKQPGLPLAYELKQNYPNPFNPATQFKFDLPVASKLSLLIYDVLGRQVAELANGFHEAGSHSVTWNASNQASGFYFARFNVADANGNVKYSKVNKLVLMK